MARKTKLFLSYCEKDSDIVSKIAKDLQAQGFEVLQYCNLWKPTDLVITQLGVSVPEECEEMIARCDYFISLISSNSVSPLTGRFTAAELEYALSLYMLEDKRIVPAVLSIRSPRKQWLLPFDRLEPLCNLALDTQNFRSYIRSMTLLRRAVRHVDQPEDAFIHLQPFWSVFSEATCAVVRACTSSVLKALI